MSSIRNEIEIEPPVNRGQQQKQKISNVLIVLAALTVAIWGFIEAKRFLVTLFGAILFALLLMPLIRFLKRHKIPEWVCLAVATLLLILPMLLIAGTVVSEIHSMSGDWPKIQESVTNKVHGIFAIPWLQSLMDQLGIDSPIEKITSEASAGVHYVMEGLMAAFSIGAEFGLMLFFAVVMLGSRNHIRASAERIFKFYKSTDQVSLIDSSAAILEKFLAARLMVILIVTAVDFVILRVFGLQYSLTAALFLGVSTLIPVIGFLFGIAPPLALAAAEGHSAQSIAIMFFLVWAVSSIQDHFLAPKLLGRHLNLNFLVTYVAFFAGERMWGMAGMFLSVPLLAVVQVLLSSSERFRPWAELMQNHEKDEPDPESKAE